jgi:hypothetical protein
MANCYDCASASATALAPYRDPTDNALISAVRCNDCDATRVVRRQPVVSVADAQRRTLLTSARGTALRSDYGADALNRADWFWRDDDGRVLPSTFYAPAPAVPPTRGPDAYRA